MKVILLVIDTLRADHLGCYGYHRNTSPNLDRIAREGAIFLNAYPSDVPTQPSFTSMFTGRRGIETGIVSHSRSENLSETYPFFTETLVKHGVRTAAVSTLYMVRRWFAKGFQYYMNPYAGVKRKIQQVDAEEINSMAIPWIREHKGEDFFLFIHYWDPHSLYLPPPKYRRLFYKGNEKDPENHSLDVLKSQVAWIFTKRHVEALGENITDIEYIIAQYDGEIRYADDNVGFLRDVLEDLGIWDDMVFIMTSDHGESLGEHHFYFDHHEVYETTIHVPLIVRFPQEIGGGTKIEGLVQSTISIAPTILKLFGITPPSWMEGKDLVEIAKGKSKCLEEIYVNQGLWTAKRAIRRGEWKLIKTYDKAFWETPDIELYNLERDPGETKNLADEKPELVDELELRMYRWLRRKLGKRLDPLEVIVSKGLPYYHWIKKIAEEQGMLERYDEWRMKVDRAEI